MSKDKVLVIDGWRFAAVFILLGLMFLLATVGVLAIIIGIVDLWPNVYIGGDIRRVP